MILICEIVDAVQREIRSAYPDAAQYIDQAPETPKMPGFVTQYIAMVTKDANRWHVNLTRYFTITCLAQPGQDNQPNATELLQMQENVINRFGCAFTFYFFTFYFLPYPTVWLTISSFIISSMAVSLGSSTLASLA